MADKGWLGGFWRGGALRLVAVVVLSLLLLRPPGTPAFGMVAAVSDLCPSDFFLDWAGLDLIAAVVLLVSGLSISSKSLSWSARISSPALVGSFGVVNQILLVLLPLQVGGSQHVL
ncbi:MAG TPA: hypothetical protein ENI97_06155 [Gammaproteobacteria bacterium]|nr:hypothetical protein [Gammaproteobacteria bacterium]